MESGHTEGASFKRRLLAWYVDLLLYSGPYGILLWVVADVVPDVPLISWPVKIAIFVGYEFVLLRFVGTTPAYWALGIRPGPLLIPGGPDVPQEIRTALVNDPWIKLNERWWTMAFGVLCVLDGAKAFVRWTMWTPPGYLFGVQLGTATSGLISLVSGALLCAVGIAALRLDRKVLPLGLAFYGYSLLSTVAGWKHYPDWIEQYVFARKAYQGRTVGEGEVEFMQSIVPPMAVGWMVVMILWLIVVSLRVYSARRPETVNPSEDGEE